MHLRHTAEAVGILHARIANLVRLANFALAQEPTEMFGCRLLAGMRSRLLDSRIERVRGAFEGFETHRTPDACNSSKT